MSRKTLAEEGAELSAAVRQLFDTLSEALRLPAFVAWLNRKVGGA